MHKVLLIILTLVWSTGDSAKTAWADTVTIAALGDSLVHGYGLPPEQGFVPQLERALIDAGRDVRVINAGVSGDTSTGGAARVDWTLTPDVDAMIVVLGGNDMLRGIDPGVVRGNIAQILATARDKGVAVLLVGMRAPGNYGPDYRDAFDALYPELAAEYDALLYPHFFAAFDGEERTPEALRAVLQPDGLHPNAEGVARVVEDMEPSVARLIDRAGAS